MFGRGWLQFPNLVFTKWQRLVSHLRHTKQSIRYRVRLCCLCEEMSHRANTRMRRKPGNEQIRLRSQLITLLLALSESKPCPNL